MPLMSKKQLLDRLAATEVGRRLTIRPLLHESQIGQVSIDLRLGYDFLVSVLSKKPLLSIRKNDDDYREPTLFFKEARRDIGETFILYPSQAVLTTTLEYIGLPFDVYADVMSRSSYNRLGISLNTMFQPGFRVCLSLELFNHSNSPVELVVGSRIVQARFFEVSGERMNYFEGEARRKYIGHVRPTASRAAEDPDLSVLKAAKRPGRSGV